MNSIEQLRLAALKAAAEKAMAEKQEAEKAGQKKTKTTEKSGTKKTTATKHKDTPKQSNGAQYVIPAEFKAAIEENLMARPEMGGKVSNLNKNGKSIDKCCEYIFGVMRRRAEKARGGKRAVGMYVKPDEIFGLAIHYYDESDEDLKKEETK